ncbi:protein phosphatase 1 regulatory subunit 12A isoform X2 [Anopheles aquasalis]|uniref:protein phosphatase 1 regulatory subunit 12A isoform X2 n=1 Tax=Anopheles aquasalis TaxID=42839 RepID=UPI00215B6F12|nr:protein phosphatase 1 regulatory subunit 12A isoform X2 [Anopheles aquasalis]
MSLDNRNTSAQFKRAEQLKRWEESDMAKQASGIPKSPSLRRIQFTPGCIFLAACDAGDKDEVEYLLQDGADIDTANVDGLTALHQACIDDNLDMVEFLVQKGADVNRKDNEGWTPLHATASCGFLSIARYLIENGADLAAINSDGELPVDLANSDAMEDLIHHHNEQQGIDCDEARQAEERIMLSDATKWLRTDSSDCDRPDPKTGATAMHVAAAKGYNRVLKLLLEGRGDIDRQDVDGWTPLHAAVYWGQKEATQMLLDAGADIDIQNYSGQLASDNAPKDILVLLDKARKNQARRTKRRPPSLGNRITDGFENSTETPTKVIRVEMKPIDNNKEKEDELLPKPVPIISRPSPVPLTAQIVVPKPRITESLARTTAPASVLPGAVVSGTTSAAAPAGDATTSYPPPPTAPWRRQRAVPTPVPRHFYANEDETSAMLPGSSGDAVDYANLCFATSSSGINNTTATRKLVSEKENQPTEPDVILRRTQSFENDEKFYQKYAELRARIQANSCTPHALLPPSTLISNTKTSTASTNNNNSSNNNNNNNNINTTTTGSTSPASNISSYLVQRSASLKDHRTLRKTTSNLVLGSTATSAATTPASAVAPTTVTNANTTTTVPSAGSAVGQTAVSNTTATISPPTSPSGTPTTTPTAGQIRSISNTDNNIVDTSSFADRYRKRYDDRSDPSSEVRDTPIYRTATGVETLHHSNHETPSQGLNNGGSKNHSLFELNRKYIEQAQKTKINNERNKFLSSLNEKRQQQRQELHQEQEEEQEEEEEKKKKEHNQRNHDGDGRIDADGGGMYGGRNQVQREEEESPVAKVTALPVTYATPAQQPPTIAGTAPATPTTPSSANKLSPGNIFKNFFKSFVPPTRDEESETQRKAHAKRVRETRRSTQGVTLDEIKSAEQLVKKKNNPTGTESETTATGVNVTNATTTNTTTIPSSTSSPSSLSCYTSSPSSLSSSMTSATSTTASINDRVPAVKNVCSNNNNDNGNNGEAEIPCGDELKNGDETPVVVSASFTLPAPSAVTASIEQGEDDGGGGGGGEGGGRRHRRSLRESDNETERKNDKEESGEKEDVTVSYTISAPALRSSGSSAPLLPPSSTSSRTRLNSREGNEAGDQRGETVTPSVTATFHVSPPSTGTTTATTKPTSATGSSSPTAVSTGASIAEHPSAGSISASATIRTTVGNGQGGAVSNSNSSNITNTSTTTTTNNTNAITTAGGGGPITTTSSSTYTKRSLFDIDNANSLTLAEKLRHEANKYAIAADADSELGPLGEDSTASSRAVQPATVTNTNEANPADSDSTSGSNAANAPTDNSASVATAAAAPLSPSLRKDAATASGSAAERRPSWRLKVDGGSKFKLEDASTPNVTASTTQSAISGSSHESTTATPGAGAEHGSITTKLTSTSALAQRRLQQQQQQQQQQNGDSTTSSARPVSAGVGSSATSVSSLPAAGEQYNRVPGTTAASTEPVSTDASLLNLRRPPRSTTASGGSVAGEENKENDKENDSRTAQATQAVIQRRRRQKRRSTGVVPVGMEDLDPDRQDSPVDGEEKETGSERGRSRVGSTASELDTASQQEGSRENGGDFIDYKALYEQEKAEKEKLKASLRKKDEEVVTLKAALDRFTTATTKNNSLSELEKRERRAMERKMSEMEEELKLLQKYKTENERLRAENRALTRVVSKLTTSAQNQMQTNKQ